MIKKLKERFSYSDIHYFILRFTNPNYIKFLNKEYLFHKKFLNSEKLIFDLGANRGDKTHVFLKFSKKVVAYEPEKKMNQILHNRFRNSNLVIKKKLVSNNLRKIKFFVVKNNEAYSTIKKKSLNIFNHLNKNNIKSKLLKPTTLNFEILKYGVPNYIKIDCEGAENIILQNFNHRVSIISFELNLPDFFYEGKKIINYFNSKFKSKFNIRIHNSYNFYFKKKINSAKCIKFLKKKKFVVEVFIFS